MYIHGIQKLKFMEMIKSPILLLVYKQWGNGSFSYGSTYKDISLPISFPNSILCVLCSDAISDSATSGQVESLAWNSGASTNSKIRFLANSSSSGYKSLGAFTWIAVCN